MNTTQREMYNRVMYELIHANNGVSAVGFQPAPHFLRASPNLGRMKASTC